MSESVIRRYTFKLYPNAVQTAALHEQRMMMADLWNALLQRNEDCYRRTNGQRHVSHGEGRSRLSFFDMTNEITKLRAECPEWRALSVWSAHRVAFSLDEAFKTFFRRAKSGAGKQSGYPHYRARRRSTSIPHRCASGCKLSPRVGERSGAEENPGSAREWRLALKGVSGAIRARGEFPSSPMSYKDADVIWRDDSWWLSVCVEMAPRRSPGAADITISFDLIDEFARVERAEGRRTACDGSARALTQNPNHLNEVAGSPGNGDSADSDMREPPRALHAHDRPAGNGDSAGSDVRARRRGRPPCLLSDGDSSGSGVRDDRGPSGSGVRGMVAARPLTGQAATGNGDSGSGVRGGVGREHEHPFSSSDDLRPSRTERRGIAAGLIELELFRARELTERADAIKSARDTRYPRKPFKRDSWRRRRETARAARCTTKAARIRREALHVWSTTIVGMSRDLTVCVPDVKQCTASPKGDAREWGANVDTVSSLNANTLNQAPALAAAMLAYKAAEAGIRCDVVTDETPKIAVGTDLVVAGRKSRQAGRIIRRTKA